MENKEYTEQDMLLFSWWLIRNLGQFVDDKEAHDNGDYLKLWKNENK